MPYYTRVFCTSDAPALDIVLAELGSRGIVLTIDESEGKVDAADIDWSDVPLLYKAKRQPIVVGCDRDDGSDDCLVREECAEFMEDVQESPADAAPFVREHLGKTRCIVTCQLLSDIDDDGYDANGEFMLYFVRRCQGTIQADGEGFYDGEELIVPLE